MIYDGTMNSQMMIKFMKRLIKGADWKMFLILDNLRVHHSKIVKDWVAKHEDVVWLNLLLFIEGLLDVSFGRFNGPEAFFFFRNCQTLGVFPA